jgi:hypothetical protein
MFYFMLTDNSSIFMQKLLYMMSMAPKFFKPWIKHVTKQYILYVCLLTLSLDLINWGYIYVE